MILRHDLHMAADWINSLSTSLVGVAGISATWLAGRRQARLQVDLNETGRRERHSRERREERKHAYVILLTELTQINILISKSTASGTDRWLSEIDSRLGRVHEGLTLIGLIVSREVMKFANSSIGRIQDELEDLRTRDGKDLDRTSPRLLAKLMTVMAEDLERNGGPSSLGIGAAQHSDER